jgi:predicted enzyme related to lactoylglutathione lyase
MKVMTQLAMIPVLVEDQDEALHFYTEKLGLEKRTDQAFGPGMRWLTVAPKGQKKPEIALAKPDASVLGEERTRELMERIGQGPLWVFGTDDCHKTYEVLQARGVKFLSAPTKQLHGVEAVFEDPYGNKFSLLEPSPDQQVSAQGGTTIGTAA